MLRCGNCIVRRRKDRESGQSRLDVRIDNQNMVDWKAENPYGNVGRTATILRKRSINGCKVTQNIENNNMKVWIFSDISDLRAGFVQRLSGKTDRT